MVAILAATAILSGMVAAALAYKAGTIRKADIDAADFMGCVNTAYTQGFTAACTIDGAQPLNPADFERTQVDAVVDLGDVTHVWAPTTMDGDRLPTAPLTSMQAPTALRNEDLGVVGDITKVYGTPTKRTDTTAPGTPSSKQAAARQGWDHDMGEARSIATDMNLRVSKGSTPRCWSIPTAEFAAEMGWATE
jgi:hypothetical protein